MTDDRNRDIIPRGRPHRGRSQANGVHTNKPRTIAMTTYITEDQYIAVIAAIPESQSISDWMRQAMMAYATRQQQEQEATNGPGMD